MILAPLLLVLAAGLPSDAPQLRPDLDRAPLTGRSSEWLMEELARVEEARPSAAWFIGTATLIGAGVVVALFGFLVADLERCGLFNRECLNPRPPEFAISFWVGGGLIALSGAFLTGMVAHLRAPGARRLDELSRAILDLGPPYPPGLQRFDPPQESTSRKDW